MFYYSEAGILLNRLNATGKSNNQTHYILNTNGNY